MIQADIRMMSKGYNLSCPISKASPHTDHLGTTVLCLSERPPAMKSMWGKDALR